MKRLVAALAIALAGCASDPPPPTPPPTTEDVPTKELSLRVDARSDGPLALVFVSVFHFGTGVLVGGGDRVLVGPSGGQLTGTTVIDTRHVAEVATDSTDVDVVLLRGDGTSAKSTLHMPPGFAISAPDGELSRSTPITLTWEKSSNAVALTVLGECIQSFTRNLNGDPGKFDIQPADLFKNGAFVECTLEVDIDRKGTQADFSASLDAAESTATLDQIRVALLPTVP